MSDARRVPEIFGEGDAAMQAFHRLVRITQHPERNCPLPVTTHRRIVSTIEKGVRAMLLAVVKGKALATVIVCSRKFADPELGRPRGMMRLHAQPWITD